MHAMIPAIGFLIVALGLTTAAGKSLTHAAAFRHGTRAAAADLFDSDCTTFGNPETLGGCMSKINAGINPDPSKNGDVQPGCHWCAGADTDTLVGNCRAGKTKCKDEQTIDVYGFVHNNPQWPLGETFMLQSKDAGLRWQISQCNAMREVSDHAEPDVKKFFESIYTTGTDPEGENGELLEKGKNRAFLNARKTDDVENICAGSFGPTTRRSGLLEKWVKAVSSNYLGKKYKFDFTDYDTEPGTVVTMTLAEIGCKAFCKKVIGIYCTCGDTCETKCTTLC